MYRLRCNDFFSFEHATPVPYILPVIFTVIHAFIQFPNSLPVMFRKSERQRWKLAIVRFRWLEAASGTDPSAAADRRICRRIFVRRKNYVAPN